MMKKKHNAKSNKTDSKKYETKQTMHINLSIQDNIKEQSAHYKEDTQDDKRVIETIIVPDVTSDVMASQEVNAELSSKDDAHFLDAETLDSSKEDEYSNNSSDYDTDLEEAVGELTGQQIVQQTLDDVENAGNGRGLYEEMCSRQGVVPIRRLAEQFPLNSMLLQHVGLNGSQCKALACGLWQNMCIEHLDLEDNGLTTDGLVTILNIVRTKPNVTSVSLSENTIDTVGAMAVHDLMRDTVCLTHLNLSGTKLQDKEIEHISAGLQTNETIQVLDLSHNCISDEGSKTLGRAIGDATVLLTLNLSWNHIRLAGAVGILKGLKNNNSLLNLDLSMNGLGFEGSLQLEETLHVNSCLKFLDISNNRINWEGVSYVAKGLRKNSTLQMLKIGNNPINMEGCYELLKAMAHRRSTMAYIGLDNIPVNGAVLTVANEIMKVRHFTITHGGILHTRDVVGIRKEKPEDPISLVVRYLATVGMRIIDIFRMFDSDNDGLVSRREFVRGLKRFGVPLSERDLHTVATRLDKSKKGMISYGLLSNCVRNHIREERKEDKRLEVKKKHRLDERRRILQTELPEITKRQCDDDMSLFLSYSSTNLSSPLRSATGSTTSIYASQVPILPPIDGQQSPKCIKREISQVSTAPEIQQSDTLKNATDAAGDNNAVVKTLRRMSSVSNVHRQKTYKLMRVINAYLERKKTLAKIEVKTTSNTSSVTNLYSDGH